MTAELPYGLHELLDSRNETLHREVSEQAQIHLVGSDDKYWGEASVEQTVTIYVAPAKHPQACYAHELLHAKLELQGWRQPRIVSSRAGDQELVGYLYNQLAHWRMYPEFERMGYPASAFLNDRDRYETEKMVRRDLPTIEESYARGGDRPLSGMLIALPFVATYSPHEQGRKKSPDVKRLYKMSDVSFLKRLALLLQEAKGEAGSDVVALFERLFLLCGRPNTEFRPSF